MSTWLVLSLMLSQGPTPESLVSQAAELAGEGKIEAAKKKLEQAHQLAPQNTVVLYNLGVIREATGDAAGAMTMYDAYLRAAPDAADAPDVLSRLRRLQAQTPIPSKAREHFLLGQAYLKHGRLGEADVEFTEAVKLAPHFKDALLASAVLAERLERDEDALNRFRTYRGYVSGDEAAMIDEKISELLLKVNDAKRADQRLAQAEEERKKREAEEAKLAEQRKLEEQKRQEEQAKVAAAEAEKRQKMEAEARAAAEREAQQKAFVDSRKGAQARSGLRSTGFQLIALGALGAVGTGTFMYLGNQQNVRILSGGHQNGAAILAEAQLGQTFNILTYVSAGVGVIGLGTGITLAALSGGSTPAKVSILPVPVKDGAVVSMTFQLP